MLKSSQQGDREKIFSGFRSTFERDPAVLAVAPGRVNLIGEHTDYNQGLVLPVAIDRHIWVAAAPRKDSRVRLVSLNDPNRVEIDLRQLRRQGNWADYPQGVIQQLQSRNLKLTGADLLFWGDVPVGSGLSSSAAIEVAALTALEGLFGFDLPLMEKIRLAQAAENEFVGVPCGIMDQFAVLAARPDHALFLDCRSLDFEHVPFHLRGYRLVIIDSKVERSLAASAYDERQRECAEGVRLLSEHNPRIRSLRDVSIDKLIARREDLPDRIFRRCRHVVTENRRVLDAVAALRHRDLPRLGRLFNESHQSLRQDYEVSSAELDCLVDSARSQPGVLGARLTGAGFGGCAIALVAADRLESFAAEVDAFYAGRFNRHAEFYVTAAEGGAHWERP